MGYKATDGTCDTSCTAVATDTGYEAVTPNSEDSLAAAVSNAPISIAIQADQASFQFYSGGVMTGSCGTSLDHGVLLVGYGTDGGDDYWKVKNSWGASWGEDGYIRLGKGSQYNSGSGQCGLAMQPVYPTV